MQTGDILTCDKGLQLEVLHAAPCQSLSCCGTPMQSLDPKTADAKNEKHVPVIEEIDGGYKVKVGSIPHPMEAEHHIQWIELRVGNKLFREYLEPGKPAEATFFVDDPSAPVAREHCNIHGLWQG